MIRLNQLNGEAFFLNADLIRYIEAKPDTIITLTTGERLVVRENMDEVVERAIRYQQLKHWIPAPIHDRSRETDTRSTAALSCSPRQLAHANTPDADRRVVQHRTSTSCVAPDVDAQPVTADIFQ